MLIFDTEVFSHDWLFVAIDPSRKEQTVIYNDREKLQSFYGIHKKDVWCGYNSVGYDQHIIRAILTGDNPKFVSDWIVRENKPGWQYFGANVPRYPIINYDVMSKRRGLKTLEAHMGSNIYESKISFALDRKLTDSEMEETIRYCKNDVYQTYKVMCINIADFNSKFGLVQQFKLPLSALGKTDAQISALILGATKKAYFDEYLYEIPKTLKIGKYTDVLDWFKSHIGRIDYEDSYLTDICGVPHLFAWGGLHGAREHYSARSDENGQIWHIDVNSYYPSIMIRYDCLSRSVSDKSRFKDIYDSRLKYKKEKNPIAASLKIVVNSTYGASKDKNSALFDERMCNQVVVIGQLLLTDLLDKLEPHIELIQSNTDGLVVKSHDDDKVMEICEEWENRTGMTLAKDKIDGIWQRDVNNYLMAMADGKIDSKGAFKLPSIFDNELGVVKHAVKLRLMHGIQVEQTINNATNLIDFQKIVKIDRKTYDFGVHYENGKPVIQNENVYRVFATTDPSQGAICKSKYEYVTMDLASHTETVYKADKFANTPDQCVIVNDDITNEPTPEWLDRSYYIKLAEKLVKSVDEQY